MSNENKEPITDKALNRLLVGSVLSILVCLVALCSTTYCWFTETVKPFKSSTIQAAPQCLLEIVVDEDGAPLSNIEDGVTLMAGVTYKVTLVLPSNSSSGYCQIFVGEEVYRSPYIVHHDSSIARTLFFYVRAETDTEVKFVRHWGLYSAEPSVLEGETLVIG